MNIKQIRAAIDQALDRVQARAEAAEVQMKLGQMEFEQRFRGQLDELARTASEVKRRMDEAGLTEDEIREKLESAVDQLRVQLKLGEMEGREAFDKVKREIERRVTDFNAALDDVTTEPTESQQEDVEGALEDYSRQAADVQASLDARRDRLDG